MAEGTYVDFVRLSEQVRKAPYAAVQLAHGRVDAGTVGQEIYAAHITLRAAQRALQDAVDRAGEMGLTWTAIGRSLGITKQAAQQRFGT